MKVPKNPIKVFDLVCFSHLRWNFVYQRPQHLMNHCASGRRVFYVEEPVWKDENSYLELSTQRNGVTVATPHLSKRDKLNQFELLQRMVDRLFADHKIEDYCLWYYTPMALEWTRHLKPN